MNIWLYTELRSEVGRLLVGLISLVVGCTLARSVWKFCSAWKLVEERGWLWNRSALYTLEENRTESDSA